MAFAFSLWRAEPPCQVGSIISPCFVTWDFFCVWQGLDLSPYFLAAAQYMEKQKVAQGLGREKPISWLHANGECTGLPASSVDIISHAFVVSTGRSVDAPNLHYCLCYLILDFSRCFICVYFKSQLPWRKLGTMKQMAPWVWACS